MRWPPASVPCGCARIRNARCAGRSHASPTFPRTATRRRRPVPSDPPRPHPSLGILLLSGAHDRAHYAFVLAAGAAALGRDVVLFATNQGCRALLADWSGIIDAARDARVRAAGVAGIEELRAACAE